MAYDPTKPQPGDDLDAVLVLAQLNALKALIDAQAVLITDLQNQLAVVLAASSNNTNTVATLGLSINNNPPQNYDVQPIADKLDELINALRR